MKLGEKIIISCYFHTEALIYEHRKNYYHKYNINISIRRWTTSRKGDVVLRIVIFLYWQNARK